VDLYTVLGIPRDADRVAIRKAYRLLARRYHPDTGTGSNSEKFRQITEAYETLIDSGRRNGYDVYLKPVGRPFASRVEPLSPHSERRNLHPLSPSAGMDLEGLFRELIRSLDGPYFR
jgi:curved DNA-binding protein CbpA